MSPHSTARCHAESLLMLASKMNKTLVAQYEKTAADEFVKDASGRTLFYPSGPACRGYEVPDTERELSLRAAMQRRREFIKKSLTWTPIFMIPFLYGARQLLGSRPFLALGVMLLPIVLAAVCSHVLFRYRMGPLLAGLQRVERRDRSAGQTRWILAFSALGGVALTWCLLQLYQWRIDTLPSADGVASYYDGISQPLMWALVCGCFLIAAVCGRKKVVAAVGSKRILWTIALLAVCELGCVGYVARTFLQPAPSLIVSRDGLVCGMSMRWADVSALYMTSGRYGKKYARLEFGGNPQPGQRSSLSPQAVTARQCQITGMNADYAAIYESMHAAWQGARGVHAAR
jgi:hypothetical protein